MSATLFTFPTWAAPRLHFDIDGQGAAANGLLPGVSVQVQVLASEIPAGTDGNGMFGFGFVAQASDLSILLGPATQGPDWIGLTFSSNSAAPPSTGLTSVLFGSTDGPIGDAILLASFSMTPTVAGSFELLALSFTAAGDNVLFDGTVLDSAGSEFFESAVFSVVPEPTIAVLLGLGMIGLSACRKF